MPRKIRTREELPQTVTADQLMYFLRDMYQVDRESNKRPAILLIDSQGCGKSVGSEDGAKLIARALGLEYIKYSSQDGWSELSCAGDSPGLK